MNLRWVVVVAVLAGLTATTSLLAEEQTPTSTTEPLRPVDVIQRSLPGTVLIETKKSNGEEGLASGFLIDSSGIVVTNLHVIRGAISVKVSLQNGDAFSRVTVRALDDVRDIAILQIPGFNLPVVPLGDSDRVKQGDTVVLLGSPLGLSGTATTGIVSAVRQMDGYRVFQTDAAANPGNSGGPMLNDRGEVVGILTFRLKEGENLNFVIPSNYARGLISVNDNLSLDGLASRYPEEQQIVGALTRADANSTAEAGRDISLSSRSPSLEVAYRHPQGARIVVQQRQSDLVLTFYRADYSVYGNAALAWEPARGGFIGFAELVYLCGSFDTRTTTIKSGLEIFLEMGGTLRMRYQVPGGINCTRNRVGSLTWGEDRWYPGR